MKHLMDQIVSLDGEWRLFYAKDRLLQQDGYRDSEDESLSTPVLSTEQALLHAGYPCICATVPGNYERSLFEAGICEDPFFGDNIEKMQIYESDHQYYVRRFPKEAAEGADLVFEGIDTVAEVFLNGRLILNCENMFIPHTVPIKKEWLRDENVLVVHIKPAVLYAASYPSAAHGFALRYNYESLYLRKAASTFGWDIMPRLCCGGIWRSVYLRKRPQTHIRDVFGYTVDVDAKKGKATVCFRYSLRSREESLKGWRLTIEGACGDSAFAWTENLRFSEGQIILPVENAKLWMPKNYGKPLLYEVRIQLMHEDCVVDACTQCLGIRRVELERSSVIESGEGEFAFSVNGQRIFVLGTNWVPLDAFHSADRARLKERLPLLSEIGCNMIRCWGGNVYEDEALYDFCDENGILIWQDFAMACGVYPTDEEFGRRLEQEIIAVVKTYRNHPSLILWAGDNECDLAHGWGGGIQQDPNKNKLTRRLIPEILQREDQSRPYLPSSPYVDEKAFRTGLPVSEDHIWGPRDYFKGAYYRNTSCRFASEVGYHGCPEPSSLKCFLSEEYVWNWRDRNGRKTEWNGASVDAANRQWLLHASCMEDDPNSPYAYRIPLMTSQIVTLFGKEPDDLETYSAMSQISQAEAIKFFIESFRIDRANRRGIIWWNLVDGWPQISDAVVDYYGRKKRAFSYIQRSQQPMALMCDEPKAGEIDVYAVNDLREAVSFTYRITNLSEGTLCAEGSTTVDSDQSLRIASLPHQDGDQRFYLLEWERDGERNFNHYVSGMEQTISYEEYLRCAALAGI